jgi:hypothetical protein
MFKLEFGIIHNNCPTNQLSRHFPDTHFTSPGGFIIRPGLVEEVLVIDDANDKVVDSVIHFLNNTPGYEECELLERTLDRAFIRWQASCSPKAFCSQVVDKNRAFKIGNEVQYEGLERWTVACFTRNQADQIIEDLKDLGEVKIAEITETSWDEVLY